MELKELCGSHILQGVERVHIKRPSFWGDELEDLEGVAFRLDGTTYLAVEDPADGYRSACEDLEIIPDVPRYQIPDVQVVCSMKPDDNYENNDILVITDSKTGEIVMEIGTGNVDDYYPYYHFDYHPESLACNQLE